MTTPGDMGSTGSGKISWTPHIPSGIFQGQSNFQHQDPGALTTAQRRRPLSTVGLQEAATG
jgi:hypothetical protein